MTLPPHHQHSPSPPPAQRRPSYATRLVLAVYLAVELVVLYFVGNAIGGFNTFLLILAISIIGAAMIRVIGLRAVRDYREAVVSRKPPGPTVVSGVIGVVGAFLIFLPGLVSTVAGLVCVFPPTRFLARKLVTRSLSERMQSPTMAKAFGPRVVKAERVSTDEPDVMEGEVVEGEVIDPDPDPRRDEGGPQR